MSSKRPIRTILKWMAALLPVVLAVLVLPPVAHADLNVPISGSTYSDANTWYLSATFRQVTLDKGGYIQVNIDVAPKLSNGSPDYMKWRIYITPNYGPIYAINQDPASWTNLGYYGPPGTFFRNSFARGTTCPNCNHNFSGNEDY